MTSPKNATTSRSGSRFYTWQNENYWSSTTVISGGVPKPALLPWGIKSVSEGAVMRRDALAAMFARCKTPDECTEGRFCQDCMETVRWLKGIPYATRDAAADLGTDIHTAVEAHSLGRPMPPWADNVKPYMVGFEQFLVDYSPKFTATEASVYNRTQKYAGTLDAIVTLTLPLREEPGTYVLDTKSGKGVYSEVGLQLASYRHAEFIGLPDGSEAPMPTVDGGLCLHLTPVGYRLIEVRCDDVVFQSFLFAREVFRWQQETSKSVLGLEYGSAVEDAQEVLV
jgi:hypothetical protein